MTTQFRVRRRAIDEVLSDEQRSGRPREFITEQLTMIFAVACEAMEESGRPVARKEFLSSPFHRLCFCLRPQTQFMAERVRDLFQRGGAARICSEGTSHHWMHCVSVCWTLATTFSRTMAKPYRRTYTGQPLRT